MKIKYVKLVPDAPDFSNPRENDAGYDLRSNENVTIHNWEWETVGTGIAIQIPHGYVGLVRGRSGLAFKETVFPFHGTIDSSYRGEWKLLIKLDPNNDHCGPYVIKRGDKIAQVIFVPYINYETELVDALDPTNRGENGFGSTDTQKDFTGILCQ